MGMNPTFKPFSDKRVRQAINHAIDTDLIIKRLVKDKAYRATSWLPLFLAGLRQEPEALRLRSREGEEAAGRGGLSGRLRVRMDRQPERELGHADRRGRHPDARQGRHQGRRSKPVEAAVLAEIVRKGDFQAYIWSNSTGPDPLGALKCFHSATPRSACNYSTFKNPEFDKLLDEAGRTDDVAKRIELLKKANALLYEEAPVWFFNYNKAVHGVSALAARPAAERDRARAPVSRRLLWVDETLARAK